MKVRGTRGGIILSLSAADDAESIEPLVEAHRELFGGKVFLEVSERIPWEVVVAVGARVAALGGQVADVRPPNALSKSRGETVIIARTIRSGGRVESAGSVVVLGDVNAGAEIIAEDDIIVIGMLRGLAHAGAGGNDKAIIWARQILAPQLRIGGALAQAGEAARAAEGPELAHLSGGQIVVRPWDK
ncbi:MAG TPA: septum site-determining protein MinC [Trueperaceae bacterium]